jgi:transcriptional regulator of acetoin/glycerol metabolism
VRELQNLIEPAVIRSNDGVLPNPLPAFETDHAALSPEPGTFADSTRAVISQVLRAAGWVIGGPSGAAAKLGVKRTTLIAKMKKLRISRPVHREDDTEEGAASPERKKWWQAATE